MLPSEIEPFAQAHIEALGDVKAMLDKVHGQIQGHSATITLEDLEQAMTKTSNAQRAFYRFQQCMIDEHKMKERLETRVLNCRLNHK